MKLCMFLYFSLLSIILSNRSLAEGRLKTLCYGPEDSEKGIIYLHGFKPSNAFIKNAKFLEEISKKMKLRIDIPESESICMYKGKKVLCWKRDSADVVRNGLDLIKKSSSFPPLLKKCSESLKLEICLKIERC